MWGEGARFVLWVGLGSEKEGMDGLGELDHLDKKIIGTGSGDYKSFVGQCLAIIVVELIAVTVALGDLGLAINLVSKSAGFD